MNLYKTEEVVERVLRQHKDTRSDDFILIYRVFKEINENEVVLDNCMGSGSTGVACINTNRNFIGIELNENYFKIAKERIEKISLEG